jgi:hypothetical protein
VAPVLGVSSGPTGHHASELAGNDGIAIRAADSVLRTFADRSDTAGTFPTDATAETKGAEFALRLLCVVTVENGFNATLFRYG